LLSLCSSSPHLDWLLLLPLPASTSAPSIGPCHMTHCLCQCDDLSCLHFLIMLTRQTVDPFRIFNFSNPPTSEITPMAASESDGPASKLAIDVLMSFYKKGPPPAPAQPVAPQYESVQDVTAFQPHAPFRVTPLADPYHPEGIIYAPPGAYEFASRPGLVHAGHFRPLIGSRKRVAVLAPTFASKRVMAPLAYAPPGYAFVAPYPYHPYEYASSPPHSRPLTPQLRAVRVRSRRARRPLRPARIFSPPLVGTAPPPRRCADLQPRGAIAGCFSARATSVSDPPPFV
jgi:hypothetical protein